MTERARILGMRFKNVKCVSEFAIDDVGDIVEIRGEAGQGKSAVLHAIYGALYGLDPRMVKLGADKAEIQIDMSNLTLKRIVAADGSSDRVMVTGKDGGATEEGTKAKAILRQICGRSAFNPIAWVLLSGGEGEGLTERCRQQRDMLLAALPVNLTGKEVSAIVQSLGDQYTAALAEVNLDGVDYDQNAFLVCLSLSKACYEFRHGQNVLTKQAKATLDNNPIPVRKAPDASLEECRQVETQRLEGFHSAKAQLEGFEGRKTHLDKLQKEHKADEVPLAEEVINSTMLTYNKAMRAAEQRIVELEAELTTQRSEYAKASAGHRKGEEKQASRKTWVSRAKDIAELQSSLGQEVLSVDLAALQKAHTDASLNMQARREQDAHDNAEAVYDAAQGRSDAFTRLIGLFKDELPKALISQADLGVEGLSVDDDGVYVGGIPVHQMGTSAQIETGVNVGWALNGKCGFQCVDRAESLGRKDRLALVAAAKAKGLQLWMTIVDSDAEPGAGTIVMRAGAQVES